MPTILASARVFGADQSPMGGLSVTLQRYAVGNGDWVDLGTEPTDDQGQVQFRPESGWFSNEYAPALRLIEAQGTAEAVLAAGPIYHFDAEAQRLTADFGEVERLADSAYSWNVSAMGTTPERVAGIARRTGLSLGNMMFNSTIDPVIATEFSSTRRPAGGTSLGDLRDRDHSAELWFRSAHDLQMQLQRKDQELLTVRSELNNAKERVAELQAGLEHQVAAAEAAATAAAKVKLGTEVDVASLLTEIGSKIGAAGNELKSQSYPFKLGIIKIDVKGKLSEAGTIFVGGEDQASGVSAELHADQAQGPTDTRVEGVPSVIGLTDSAARRVLRAAGLRLQAATESVDPKEHTPGQALRQHPAAGTEKVEHGSDVLVVFGVAAQE